MQTVTYCPEDNKLRLYVGRVPRDEYEQLRAAGFVSTPKQDCDFVATWTPQREDLARQYLDDGEDIGDEDYSPAERSADRAERFGDYRDKRAAEAGASADAFDAGPAAFGHQNRSRAERQARRHDRHRVYAVSQWSKAEYWQTRTASVIGHRLHLSNPRTRRGRILTLEAEQRKQAATLAQYRARFNAWRKVATLDGANERIPEDDENPTKPAARLAYALANLSHGEYKHPREDRKASLWRLLYRGEDRLTPAEAAALWLEGASSPDDPQSWSNRWARHYELRLSYERAMLEAEGGTAAAADIEPGGWFGRHQVQKVNRSAVTGRVVSVGVIGPHPWRRNDDGTPVIGVQTINIERLPADSYRAPTDEERAAFAAKKKAEKESRTPCPTINPTPAEAAKLQAIWNREQQAWAADRRSKGEHVGPHDTLDGQVREMTQRQFSAQLSYCAAILGVGASGVIGSKGAAFKVRAIRRYMSNRAPSVVILTDKPQKALPLAPTVAPANGELFAEVMA